MKTIPLTQGQVALVDDADYEAVSQFKWCAHKIRNGFYAARNLQRPDGKWVTQHLHTFLFPDASRIDHRDGNGLNNQRGNLRPATNQQNLQGFCRKRLGATSPFRGVSWDKKLQNWKAEIRADGENLFLGSFEFGEDAARAYDAAARKYRGEFAHLNFP